MPGSELAYRFGMATFGGPRLEPQRYVALLRDVAESFGLRRWSAHRPRVVAAARRRAARCSSPSRPKRGEAAFRVEPQRTIIDLPIRLHGVEDNGCVAVYSTARPFFRFIGVAQGSAWFQENVDAGATIWAGNVFVCDKQSTAIDAGL